MESILLQLKLADENEPMEKKTNELFSLFIRINTEINVILYLQWLYFYYTSKFIKKVLYERLTQNVHFPYTGNKLKH